MYLAYIRTDGRMDKVATICFLFGELNYLKHYGSYGLHKILTSEEITT